MTFDLGTYFSTSVLVKVTNARNFKFKKRMSVKIFVPKIFRKSYNNKNNFCKTEMENVKICEIFFNNVKNIIKL